MFEQGRKQFSERPAPAVAAGNDMMRQLLLRLERVLEDERLCLQRSAFSELESVVSNKHQLALEVQRLSQHGPAKPLDGESRALLDRMNSMLEQNARLLRRHIEAVRDIAGLITEIVSNASTDGTYTSRVPRRSPGL